MFVIIVTK